MVGITLNRGVIQCWILSQSERSATSRQCMKMTGIVLFDMMHASYNIIHQNIVVVKSRVYCVYSVVTLLLVLVPVTWIETSLTQFLQYISI